MEQGTLEGKGSLFKIADWGYKRSEEQDSPEAEGSQAASHTWLSPMLPASGAVRGYFGNGN